MKIVADNAIPFLEGVLEPYARMEYLPGKAIAAADVRDADALIVRTRTRCDATLLAGSSVKLIATATIGFDHIDTEYCHRHGIQVATAAGCNARGVLQYIAAALVHLSRTQCWSPAEKTLGIVGVGHVGSLVEAYAREWGFRVIACDPPREAREHRGFLPLEEVARQADILTFHTPLDDTTHHMASESLFRLMKPGSTLINTSRGEVVDGKSLLESELQYILDVWEHEPDLDPQLLRDALLATPHIAGYSAQGKANATALSVRTIGRYFGLPFGEWYPSGVTPSHPRKISWQELCSTIDYRFDIAAESRRLKADVGGFETSRNGYRYREEYF